MHSHLLIYPLSTPYGSTTTPDPAPGGVSPVLLPVGCGRPVVVLDMPVSSLRVGRRVEERQLEPLLSNYIIVL
jgi:hypothetical protein